MVGMESVFGVAGVNNKRSAEKEAVTGQKAAQKQHPQPSARSAQLLTGKPRVRCSG